MGMDISGMNPKSEDGVYFRANGWSWRPLLSLIYQFCEDYIEEKTEDDLTFDMGSIKPLIEDGVLQSMSCNDGEGPKDDSTCQELAERFNNWLEHNAKGCVMESDCRVEAGTGRFVNQDDEPDVITESAYSIEDEHIKEFVKFLENCGGFQVF
jgi:hypothetical protein